MINLLFNSPYSSFTVIFTAITVLLAGAWFSRFDKGDFAFHGDIFPWIALAYACLFATVYAYNAFSWAGKRVSPAITTVYNTLQPVGTSVLSVIFMGTMVTVPEIIGGVLVMSGLVITVYGRHLEAISGDGDDVIDEDNDDGVSKREGAEEYLLIHQDDELSDSISA